LPRGTALLGRGVPYSLCSRGRSALCTRHRCWQSGHHSRGYSTGLCPSGCTCVHTRTPCSCRSQSTLSWCQSEGLLHLLGDQRRCWLRISLHCPRCACTAAISRGQGPQTPAPSQQTATIRAGHRADLLHLLHGCTHFQKSLHTFRAWSGSCFRFIRNSWSTRAPLRET